MRSLFLTLFLSVPACGEIFSIGGIIGTPVTDVTETTTIAGINYLRNSNLLTVGPSVQVNLPAGFRIEIDALYRPVAYQIATLLIPINVSASQFSFPALLQYQIGKFRCVKPYAEGGLSFNYLTGLHQATGLLPSQPGAIVQTTHPSVVLGFGLDFKVPFIRISPELRYTRQFSGEFLGISQLNQGEVLVGLRF